MKSVARTWRREESETRRGQRDKTMRKPRIKLMRRRKRTAPRLVCLLLRLNYVNFSFHTARILDQSLGKPSRSLSRQPKN